MQTVFTTVDQMLRGVPATFWGVVVGSFFTLTGIYLTNRATDRRQREQLQNDREVKSREREMAFRKDTYTATAEAISVAMTALGKFSDLSSSLKEISVIYLEKSPVLAKVNLVAGEDTLRALAGFLTEFTGAFLHLTQQRMVLNDLQEQIAAKLALRGGFEKTRDAMIELMRHHNIDGVQDPRRFEAIQNNYEFEATRIAATNQELQQMMAQLSARHIPLVKECFVQTARLNPLTIPLLVAARMELDLSIGKEQYAEILHHTQAKQARQFDGFIQNIAGANEVAPRS